MCFSKEGLCLYNITSGDFLKAIFIKSLREEQRVKAVKKVKTVQYCKPVMCTNSSLIILTQEEYWMLALISKIKTLYKILWHNLDAIFYKNMCWDAIVAVSWQNIQPNSILKILNYCLPRRSSIKGDAEFLKISSSVV